VSTLLYAIYFRFTILHIHLPSAYQTALSLPPSTFSPNPYLKLSGIAAVLTEVIPDRKAREVLEDVWNKTAGSSLSGNSAPVDTWASYTLTDEERLRRVAIACKLAELSSERIEEEERWLVWAVEAVVKLAGLGMHRKQTGLQDMKEPSQTQVILAELELPSWMRKDDLAAPLAALGNLYAKKGNVE